MRFFEQAGNLFEEGFEASQRTNIALAGSAFGDVEELGDLVVGKFIEVSQGENFAVERVEAFDGLDELVVDLVANSGLAG